jgi:hypothetical protein
VCATEDRLGHRPTLPDLKTLSDLWKVGLGAYGGTGNPDLANLRGFLSCPEMGSYVGARNRQV